MKGGKVLIFSAPSGAGKSTIVSHLLKQFSVLEFSVSATSRQKRGQEVDGKDYYFLSEEAFVKKIDNNDFIEWEEVYAGTRYGTLRSEIDRIWKKGNVVVFDIDVVGGVNLKKIFGNDALSIFIQPPSIEELRNRLVLRNTDSTEAIERRVAKAKTELTYREKFDITIVNDSLEIAFKESEKVVKEFLDRV